MQRSCLILAAPAWGLLVALAAWNYWCGFLHLTADEFSKAVIAWRGQEETWRLWFEAAWLPGHFPMLAVAQRLTGELLYSTRLVSLGFGAIALTGVVRLAQRLADDRAAVIAGLLAASLGLCVWTSAAGLTDMGYVGLVVWAAAVYAPPVRNESGPFLRACLLLAAACCFHYNAWVLAAVAGTWGVVTAIRIPSTCWRSLVVGGLILATPVLAWLLWNAIDRGDPFAFLATHRAHSATFWRAAGYQHGPLAATRVLAAMLLLYAPALMAAALLTLGQAKVRRDLSKTVLPWLLAACMLALTWLLFATGGRPTAFSPRYLLLPLLMACCVSACGFRYAVKRPVGRAALVVLMGIQVVAATRFPRTDPSIDAAQQVANALVEETAVDDLGVVLFQPLRWNLQALQVFLNRPAAVAALREAADVPAPVRFVCAAGTSAPAPGFRHWRTVGRYTIYRRTEQTAEEPREQPAQSLSPDSHVPTAVSATRGRID